VDILSLTYEQLEVELAKLGCEKFRAKQVFLWLHTATQGGGNVNFSQMTNLSLQLRAKLDSNFYINSLNLQKTLVCDTDNTVKYLYALSDGEKIETVMMEYKHANSLCISTQVGCKMNCSFCASGSNGFVRNLSPGEMLLQLYQSEVISGRQVGNVVLMGIGEPLDNFDNVISFLKILSDKNGRNMSLRNVSLSTCGLCDEIEQLAEYKFPLTLSISLHAANDTLRNSIMPINKKYNIERLMRSCAYYFKKTGRRISFEYALIEGVNDDENSALALIGLLKHSNSHINLIGLNKVTNSTFTKSQNVKSFQQILTNGGLNATIRRTLGAQIGAACGQLVTMYN